MKTLSAFSSLVGVALLMGASALWGQVSTQSTDDTTVPWPPVATFSILGYDPDTGEVGGAVQSRVSSLRLTPTSGEWRPGILSHGERDSKTSPLRSRNRACSRNFSSTTHRFTR